MVPNRDGSYMDRIKTMREELKHKYQWDVDIAERLPPDEVEEAHDKAALAYTSQKHLIDQVKFPIYPSSELKETTEWATIFTIHFCDGGTFIRDPSLKEHIPALLHLFSSYVQYDNKEKKRTTWQKDPGAYDALPLMLLDFALNSRVDDGHRMVERCLRHGLDPRMKYLFHNKADIIRLVDGTLGLVIKATVPASMKGVWYANTVANTSTDILAVGCDCKVGSTRDEEDVGKCVVCVHIPVIPYKLTQLMHEGLAEHILIELTSCISSFTRWSPEEIALVKESIIILMEAAGESVMDGDKQSMAVAELLERFLTGTEKAKSYSQSASKSILDSQPGPFIEMCFDSPTKKSKELKYMNKKKKDTNQLGKQGGKVDVFIHQLNESDNVGDDGPNYLKAFAFIKAAGIDVSSFGDSVGWKLLKLRADSTSNSFNEIVDLHENMCKDWKLLKEATLKRSINFSESHSELTLLGNHLPKSS